YTARRHTGPRRQRGAAASPGRKRRPVLGVCCARSNSHASTLSSSHCARAASPTFRNRRDQCSVRRGEAGSSRASTEASRQLAATAPKASDSPDWVRNCEPPAETAKLESRKANTALVAAPEKVRISELMPLAAAASCA